MRRLPIRVLSLLCVSLLVLLTTTTVVVQAASPEENRAFEVALKLFQDGLFDQVDRECGAYVAAYPASERLLDILLLQAQARIRTKRYAEAISLLTSHTPAAGAKADEFAFWLAQALFEQGQLGAAAEAFAKVATSFPESPRRLNAAYLEAYARFKVGEADRSVLLLRNPDGAFAQAAKTRPEDEVTVRGQLLLAEILLGLGDFPGAEAALAPIGGRQLAPELNWERDFLSARVKSGAGQIQAAYPYTTNLWTSAPASIPADLRSAALLLQAELQERLGLSDAALQTLEQYLGAAAGSPHRQRALQQYIDISRRQKTVPETIQRLETFLKASPQDAALDLVRLTLGELKLKEYYAARGAGATPTAESLSQSTNLLLQARTQFDLLITNHPLSSLVGRAHLNRGWCFWEEGTNRLAEGLAAFREAALRLPVSADQAVARFKWADCQWQLADLGGAVSNYWAVATNSPAATGATNTLVSQALYQIVRAGVDANDLTNAAAALNHLLRVDLSGQVADRAELLVGQALTRLGQPQAARSIYDDFLKRFTNSSLLPEISLSIAKTYEQEQAWPAALSAYADWLATYRNHPAVSTGMTAQASFDLARVSYRANPDTNSLALLTNFIAQYPDNTNAPLAQYLVGEYAFGQGEYARAELHFQDRTLVQNTNPLLSELTYRARLMAGRAAVARQSYRSARDHFDWIITNGPLHLAQSPIPVSVVAEAYLFRGDTLTLEPAEAETNNLARFGEAINAFSKITDRFPTNEFAPLAWGRIGECHFQLASVDPKRYESAAAAFRKVIESSADVSVRSQAEWKLAIVLEKQAQLRPLPERASLEDEALDHYLRVLYQKNLRAGESPDPYWIKRAGLSAMELAETQKKWDLAIGLSQRLMAEIPSLSPRLQKKLGELQVAKQKAEAKSN